MKKVFIDCGGFDGCSRILAFRLMPWIDTVITFEPDLSLVKHMDAGHGYIFPCAVSDCYGSTQYQRILLDKNGKPFCGGGSIIEEKQKWNTITHRSTEIITVPCIDLSHWLMLNFDKSDIIILKLDVEGEEYKILRKMVADGSLSLISKLYIEWHYDNCGFPKAEVHGFIDFISKQVQTDSSWDSMNLSSLMNNF